MTIIAVSVIIVRLFVLTATVAWRRHKQLREGADVADRHHTAQRGHHHCLS